MMAVKKRKGETLWGTRREFWLEEKMYFVNVGNEFIGKYVNWL